MSCRAIGIDLGTTYSCVGVFKQGNVEIIQNDQGPRTTPSCVAFTDTERLIGDAAKFQAADNPNNTIFSVKRIIGRKFDEPSVQDDMKYWPFDVINENGRPKIRVEYKNERRMFFPEEISSMVLAKMKEFAEAYLTDKVKDAVITVPAYFNDSQRQATKDAAKISGLNVLQIINEPTAAAIAYGLDKKFSTGHHVLIFDLGGGTLDVSILKLKDEIFEVISTSGNLRLGGEDFDNRMVDHFIKLFKNKPGKDISNNKRAIAELRDSCEKAKRNLSSIGKTDVMIGSQGLSASISRATFEMLNADLFKSTLEPVERALKEANLGKDMINDVILSGGSSRIPKVQKLLQDFFNGKELNKSIHPDEAIAYGAALYAAILSGDENVEKFLLMDVAPLTLGIAVLGGEMSAMIKCNTPIPTKHTHTYVTVFDNQSDVSINVYEGERAMIKDNNLLGSFELDGITVAPRGETKIDVTFDIDANGILHVSAVEIGTGNEKSITINSDNSRLSKNEIQRMKGEAEKFKKEDEKQRKRLAAMNKLENYAYEMRALVEDDRTNYNVSYGDRRSIKDNCQEVIDWLGNNRQAEKDHFKYRFKKLKKVCQFILE